MQMKTRAEVHYDGTIKWRPPTTFKSSCDINVKFFPFDEQECTLTFGSWTYNIEEVRDAVRLQQSLCHPQSTPSAPRNAPFL